MGANQSKTLEATRVTDKEIKTSYLKQGKEQLGPHMRLDADLGKKVVEQYRQAVLDGLFPWDSAIHSHYWFEFPATRAGKKGGRAQHRK
tara:strand:- start:644 stop:910 length:267 start_codon:yes stop_codon:yes gene_type:complete